MKAVIQRVEWARVSIDGRVKSSIGRGLLVLLGVAEGDTAADADWLARKIVSLRVFGDGNGVMNLPIGSIGGEMMVISQFTLLASYRKGNRPSWMGAARHEVSIPLYGEFCARASSLMGREVATGEFGADMKVELLNDGPVTICMDTRNKE